MHGLAAKLPLAAVGEIMGLAPDDWKQILVWSEAVVGEIRESNRLPGESRGRAYYRNMVEFRSYLEDLIEDRRACMDANAVASSIAWCIRRCKASC